MGKVAKEAERGLRKVRDAPEDLLQSVDPTRSARKSAEKAQKRQGEMIARQGQQEEQRLAEADDLIARKRALRKAGGRRSLIASR